MSDEFVDRVRVYMDKGGEWRWQALAGNNQIVADSGEGYADKAWARAAAERAFPGAAVSVEESV